MPRPRSSSGKRDREFKKREREKTKRDKAALKRQRRLDGGDEPAPLASGANSGSEDNVDAPDCGRAASSPRAESDTDDEVWNARDIELEETS